MRNSSHPAAMSPRSQNLLLWAAPPQGWKRPTFGEFLERVEHEFGSTADSSALLLLGLDRDEQLAPSDIEVLCGQLGVPPEDFGVGP